MEFLFLFYTAHDLPRRFVMIELGSQPVDVLEEGVFPLPLECPIRRSKNVFMRRCPRMWNASQAYEVLRELN